MAGWGDGEVRGEGREGREGIVGEFLRHLCRNAWCLLSVCARSLKKIPT